MLCAASCRISESVRDSEEDGRRQASEPVELPRGEAGTRPHHEGDRGGLSTCAIPWERGSKHILFCVYSSRRNAMRSRPRDVPG